MKKYPGNSDAERDRGIMLNNLLRRNPQHEMVTEWRAGYASREGASIAVLFPLFQGPHTEKRFKKLKIYRK